MRPDIIEEAAFGVFATMCIHDFAAVVQIEFRYSTKWREWTDRAMGGDEPYATIGWWYGVLAGIANGGAKQPKRVRNGARVSH